MKRKFKWIKKGKCNPKACGAFCCRIGIASKEKKMDKAKRHGNYFEFFGMKKFTILWNKKKESYYALDKPCKFLSIKNKCKIHKNRPETCKLFPQSPEWVFYLMAKKAGCTFSFEKKYLKKKLKN